MGTIAFTAQIMGDMPASDEPVFFRATSDVARDGYSVEFRELWSPDGRLLALNQQTIAIIR